jgi:hypothetical protein
MRRLLTSAVAAAVFVAASGGEANAQDMGRRMSLFDIGVYAGWSGTSKWANDANDRTVTIGTSNPVFGLISNYWFTPRIGVRAHGGYIPASIGVKDVTDFPSFFGGSSERTVNVWLYDLNLVFRPWIETNPGLLGGMYLFAGGGGLTANMAGDRDLAVGNGVVMSGSPTKSSVGQGNVGLGLDIISLTDNIGAFVEACVHGYSPPTWVNEATGASEPGLAYTGRVVAGLKLAFGNIAPLPPPPPPAPEPLPPPPPPQPTTREITVCVVQDGMLQNVTATFNPATGDTMVMQAGAERRFAEAYPATTGYAAGATWYVNDQPVRLNNRNYVKFGLTRVIDASQLTKSTDYQGVPVFTETGAATQPEVIYVPVRPGCEFQPYQLQTQIRVRG